MLPAPDQVSREEANVPLRSQLPSFWWFLEGRIGGMGRPGFNRCRWYDLTLEEGLLLSWLGKQPLPTPGVDSLWTHLEAYGPKVAMFYGLHPEAVRDRLRGLRTPSALRRLLDQLNAKTHIFEEIAWVEAPSQPALRLTTSAQRRQQEIALLKQHKVSVLISLLEHPLDHPELLNDFTVHHIPVEDVTPPSYAQVYTFAETLAAALTDGHTVVTHCLAGIGRTTTMLMAAYLVQGTSLSTLQAWVQARNPHFLFRGSQFAFLEELAHEVRCGRLPLLSPARNLPLCP